MNPEFRVGFCVSGGGMLCRAAVESASKLGIRPALLVAGPRSAPDLEAFGATHDVPVARLQEVNRADHNERLDRLCGAADLNLLCLTYDRIVPPSLISRYSGRIINVHPALLPAFSGLRGIERTVESGIRLGGATIHEVVEKVDAGPVIAQCVLPVVPGESAQHYGHRLFPLMRRMFLQVIAWFAQGRVCRDAHGRPFIRGANYESLPFSPAIEHDWTS